MYTFVLAILSFFSGLIFVWPVLVGNKKYERSILANGEVISEEDVVLLEEAAMGGDIEALHALDNIQTQIFAGKMSDDAVAEGGWEPAGKREWHEHLNFLLGVMVLVAIVMLYFPVSILVTPLAYTIFALAGLRVVLMGRAVLSAIFLGHGSRLLYLFLLSVYSAPILLAYNLL